MSNESYGSWSFRGSGFSGDASLQMYVMESTSPRSSKSDPPSLELH
uniref:Uncharacterized protein n=1 Tax=Peronospora matthiolae TaxID=2874970 RepID=A0AAV1TI47_9STRA